MEKILLFSDLHFTAGDSIIGLDPLARFNEAAEHALVGHPDASHIIFMGDLTHHGTIEEYAQLKDRFDTLPLPYTTIPGNHDLQTMLDQSDLPVIVIMHHALTRTFFDGMDSIALRNGQALGDIIATSKKVRHIINGHIHRTIFTSHQGIPVAMIKSTCHQMPLVLGKGSSSLSIVEPGAFGVLCLTDDHAVLHVEDVGLPDYT